MKKMFLFAACLAVLACSCSENEEGTVKDVRASLKINANIGAPAGFPRGKDRLGSR